MSQTAASGDEAAEPPRRTARTAVDLQRAKVAKLMSQPDKPVHMPTPRNAKNPNQAAEFVYNVMGSSAGAGSGEFHVYRQIRRKETLRQTVIQGQRERDDLNQAYHQKLEENQREADAQTAKKRQKRLKKKRKQAQAKRSKGAPAPTSPDSSDSSDSATSDEAQ